MLGGGMAEAAFQSRGVAAITASVTFQPILKITHAGLSRVPQETNIAVISGTAKSITNIQTVTLSSYVDSGPVSSTITYVSVSTGTYAFQFEMPVTVSTGSSNFYYRLSAADQSGNIGVWPTSGAYFSVDIQPPGIVHTALERISSVTAVAIATGTIFDTGGIRTIDVFYRSDTETVFSTASLVIASSPTVYNFVVEMPVNVSRANNFYYNLKASDLSGNYCFYPGEGRYIQVGISSSRTVTVGSGGGVIGISDGNPNDGETSLDIPGGALDSSVNITITEVDPSDPSVASAGALTGNSRPVSVYRFAPAGLVFKKMLKMNLLYQDKNQDGIVDGTPYSEDALRIMWWDGYEWRLIGGKVDTALNVAHTNIQHFSLYGVFPVGALSDNDYRPKEKIITPASADSINDFATFSGLRDGDTVTIFDVNGRRVRQVSNNYIWDGKDDENNIVESGLYIYQIKTSGKIISGTIVVAK
jgi:hypothetical protein